MIFAKSHENNVLTIIIKIEYLFFENISSFYHPDQQAMWTRKLV